VAASMTRIESLKNTWDAPPGFIGWLSQVNHKAIATRYFFTATFFFFLAGVSALIMRVQLARPELEIISPELYNQLFSTHGTAMMFLFAIPILEAVGMYLVPLMVGARDMIFPRLNAFGYWIYLIAGLTVWTALFTGNGPNAAWFNYVPLANEEHSPGLGIDVWTTAITFMEIAALVAAVELIATVFKLRAPGMSLNRMPIFVWAVLVMSFMILFAMPAVMLASVMLFLDRGLGTGFFLPSMGGDPLLWQHLFWIFGHPEVYIILIPGLGIVSAIVSGFARRGNTAYSLLAASFVAIGFLSFGLWVHHMYTAGLPWMSLSFFEAASMSIAIPSGIAIFSWIATLWGTRPAMKTPLLYVLGFFFIFILGGITGVMVASIQFNHQVHDTFFVVAHFHYVLLGSSVFPLLGGLHFWFPKLTGKLLDEGVGKISFWLTFLGFNLTFFPMHISGILGMPRQVYTYRAGLDLETWNMLSTIGAFVMTAGLVVVFVNILISFRDGKDAGPNPWSAGTLEWSIPSPVPVYNFEQVPRVTGRYPLWTDDEHGRLDPEADRLHSVPHDVFPDNPDRRETAGTRLVDSKLERTVVLAEGSIFPLFAAASVGLAAIGSMFTLWMVPTGLALAYLSFVGWLWPSKKEWER
jgi:cytochrome c oxidase subunit I+III